jgi:predicted dehydrogenase
MRGKLAPGEKARLVLVGCGGISDLWFRAVQSRTDCEWAGLVDLDEAAAVRRREEFGTPVTKVGTKAEAMFAELQPDIVFDCTVPVARAQVVEAALRHGSHVLSEKPMANSLEEARRLLRLAREAGRTFAIMQNRRYAASIRALREFLAGGELGGLTTLNSDFYVGAHFGGFRVEMKHVLLLDMAIHSFDQARFLSGADPVSVYCHEWNPAGSWYAHGASAVAIFEMSNGLVCTYRGSWCAEGQRTTWECDWHAVGTRGYALWDGGDKLRAERPGPRDATNADEFIHVTTPLAIPAVNWPGPDGHAGCIHHFLDCVRAGRVPETDCSDNIKSLAMVFGAIESAETGKRVAITI